MFPHVIAWCVLGVEIDTSAMTLTVPQFHLDEHNVKLHQWLEKSTYMKHALQSLQGKLSYVSACVRPGHVYMCRLLNALRDINSRGSARQITDDMRADIVWWIYLLQHYNGVSVIPSNTMLVYPVVARFVSVNDSSAVFLLPFWL